MLFVDARSRLTVDVDVAVDMVDSLQPAGRVLETALRLTGTRRAIPAVDTDVS